MALLKALNENYARQVDLQLAAYHARCGAVDAQKKTLQRALKAELVRPGSLAAVFTLGILVAPKKKSATAGDRQPQESSGAEPSTEASRKHATPRDEGKREKGEGFALGSMLSSVISATLVRMLTNWLTPKPVASVQSDTRD